MAVGGIEFGPSCVESYQTLQRVALICSSPGVFQRAVVPPDPPALEAALHRLAHFLYLRGNYSEAEPHHREIVQSRLERLSPQHEEVLQATSSLARLLARWAWAERKNTNSVSPSDHAQEAEGLLRECLAVRTRELKPTSSRLADTKSRLGGAVLSVAVTAPSLPSKARLEKLAEAQSLLLEACESLLGNSRGRTYQRHALECLVRLYTTWSELDPTDGHSVKAEQWKKKLKEFNESGNR